MNLLERLRGGSRSITTIDDYINLWNTFAYGGLSYGLGVGGSTGITQTLAGQQTELAPNNFVGLSTYAYQSNGPVFACMLVRQLVFSSIRFTWQRLRNGRPSDYYATPALRLLETPWTGGTTQDLLSRMINDADLAGNSYWYRETSLARLGTADPGGELVRMRPDWVDIIVEPRMINGGISEIGGGQVGWRKRGFVYTERNGSQNEGDPVGLHADEVAHFSPIPDPMAHFRGMSWLSPILREIQADHAMTRHQRKFFDNGATVNMVIKHPPGAQEDKVRKWIEEMENKHAGVENAYKNLNIYPGADVTTVGSNLHDIDFKEVRGGGETRIAAAAGVPPVIVGLSEGLAAATYSNYGQARRRLADGTAHPLWQSMAGSVQQIFPPPDTGSRLWYDACDVPFLREDEADAATIQATRAATLNTLITAGFTKDSAVKAVTSGDFTLLQDTGLVSVQLLPPGQSTTPNEPAATNGQPQGGSKNGATVN